MKQAVFLDRDGTLNVEKGYIRNVDDLELIPGVAKAVRQLNNAGILAILTTNQTGAARRFYDESHIQALHVRLEQLLKTEGNAYLDAIFYCPHLHKEDSSQLDPRYATQCTCRKPETGMIQQACERFEDIELHSSYVIGDKASDVQLAYNAGCQSILVKTGYGQRVLDGKYQSMTRQPTHISEDLSDAVGWILAQKAVLNV